MGVNPFRKQPFCEFTSTEYDDVRDLVYEFADGWTDYVEDTRTYSTALGEAFSIRYNQDEEAQIKSDYRTLKIEYTDETGEDIQATLYERPITGMLEDLEVGTTDGATKNVAPLITQFFPKYTERDQFLSHQATESFENATEV